MSRPQVQRDDVILVIDDDTKTLESVGRVLISEGFTVHTAPGPLEGIKAYETHSTTIKLVLLDYFMHIMNGEEVFEQLQRINPAVRVVLVTGSDDELAQRMLARGLCGFLRKPFVPEELLSHIQEQLRGAGR